MKLHIPNKLRAALLRAFSLSALALTTLAVHTSMADSDTFYEWDMSNASSQKYWDDKNWINEAGNSCNFVNGSNATFIVTSENRHQYVNLESEATVAKLYVEGQGKDYSLIYFYESDYLQMDYLSIADVDVCFGSGSVIVNEGLTVSDAYLSATGAISAGDNITMENANIVASNAANKEDNIIKTESLLIYENSTNKLTATTIKTTDITLQDASSLTINGNLTVNNSISMGDDATLTVKATSSTDLELQSLSMGAGSTLISNDLDISGTATFGTATNTDAITIYADLSANSLATLSYANIDIKGNVIIEENTELRYGDSLKAESFTTGTLITGTNSTIELTGEDAPVIVEGELTMKGSGAIIKNDTHVGSIGSLSSASLVVEGALEVDGAIDLITGVQLTAESLTTESLSMGGGSQLTLTGEGAMVIVEGKLTAAENDSTIKNDTSAASLSIVDGATLQVMGELQITNDAILGDAANLVTNNAFSVENITLGNNSSITANAINSTGDISTTAGANASLAATTTTNNLSLGDGSTLTSAGKLTINDDLSLNKGGTLILKDNEAVAYVTGQITGSNAAIELSANSSFTAEGGLDMSGSISLSDNARFDSSSSFDLDGCLTALNNSQVNLGSNSFVDNVVLGQAAIMYVNSNNLTIQQDLTIQENSSDINILGESFTVEGDISMGDASTLSISGGVKVGENLELGDGGTLNLTGVYDATSTVSGVLTGTNASLNMSGRSGLSLSNDSQLSGSITLSDAAMLSAQGALELDGDLSILDQSSVTLNDASTVTSLELGQEGSLIFTDSLDITDDITTQADSTNTSITGSTFTVKNITLGNDSTLTLNSAFEASGNLNLGDGGSLKLTGSDLAASSASGSLSGTNASLSLSDDRSLSITAASNMSGSITLSDAAMLSFAESLTLTGNVSLDGTASLSATDELDIQGSISVAEQAAGVSISSALIKTQGISTGAASVLLVTGALDNSGNLSLGTGSSFTLAGGSVGASVIEGAVTGENVNFTISDESDLIVEGELDLSGQVSLSSGASLKLEENAQIEGSLTLIEKSGLVSSADFKLIGNLESTASDLALTGKTSIEGNATLRGGESIFSGDEVSITGALAVEEGYVLIGDGDDATVATATLIDLDQSSLTMAEGSSMSTGRLIGNTESTITGHLIIDGSDSEATGFAGSYGQNTTLELLENAKATLILSPGKADGLSLLAAENTNLSLNGASGTTITSLNSSGTVQLGYMDDALTLLDASSMSRGTLEVGLTVSSIEESIRGGDKIITSGATFDISDSTVNVSLSSTSSALSTYIDVAGLNKQGLTLFTLSDNSASKIEDSTVTIEGFAIHKYFTNIHFDGQNIIADLNTNAYTGLGTTSLGTTGLSMISETMVSLNPQHESVRAQYQDLATIMDVMDSYLDPTDASASANASADRLAAAVLGVSATALNTALMSDVTRQIGSMMSRCGQLEGNNTLRKDNIMYWVSAEGGSSHLENAGYASGHNYSAFGGSLGADIQLRENMSFGVAFSAIYGDVDTCNIDSGSGDLDTLYFSLYGRYVRNKWTHDVAFTTGFADAKLNRRVDIPGAGSYSTRGNTDGFAMALSYQASYDMGLKLANKVDIKPLASISLINSSIDGYTESGSDAKLRFGEQSNTYVSLGLGVQGTAEVGASMLNKAASLKLRSVVKLDVGDRSSDVDVCFANDPNSGYRINGAEPSALGLELGVGISVPVGHKDHSIFADFSYEFRSDYSTLNAGAGYRFAF